MVIVGSRSDVGALEERLGQALLEAGLVAAGGMHQQPLCSYRQLVHDRPTAHISRNDTLAVPLSRC